MSELFSSGKGAIGYGINPFAIMFLILGIIAIVAIISYNMSKNRY